MYISPDMSAIVDATLTERAPLTVEMIEELGGKLVFSRIERINFVKRRAQNDDDVQLFFTLMGCSFSEKIKNQTPQSHTRIYLPERRWWDICRQLKLSLDAINRGDGQYVYASFYAHKSEPRLKEITRVNVDK